MAVLAVGVAACRSPSGGFGCSRRSGPDLAASAAPPRAPAAPNGLVADLVIKSPGETWRALRSMGGKDVAILPQSYALMVATLLGLPPASVATLDEGGPVLGALIEAPDGPGAVLGLHVRSPDELVAALTRGSDAKFTVSTANGLCELAARPGADVENVRFAVDQHYLLVAARATDLATAGRYVAETLAARALPESPVVVTVGHAALGRTFAAGLRERWKATESDLTEAARTERQARGGRAADFADPDAVLAVADSTVARLCDVISDAHSLEVRLEPLAASLLLRADLTTEDAGPARDWVNGLSTGSIDALSGLPRESTLALWMKMPSGPSTADVESYLGRIFGKRISVAKAREVSHVVDRITHGLGDSLTLGLVSGSVVLQGRVADSVELDAGLRDLFDLLASPTFAEPLGQMLGRPSVSVKAQPVSGITTPVMQAKLSFTRHGAPPASLRVIWTIDRDVLQLAAGSDVEPALVALTHSASDPALGLTSKPEVLALRRSLGEQAVAALIIDPARLGLAADGGASGSVFAAFGRSAARAWVRVEIPADLMATWTRRLLVR